MKSIKIIFVMIVLILTIASTSCELLFGKDVYSNVEIGETFFRSRDGYHEKLPHNYCLSVLLGTVTGLYKVPDDMLDTPYSSSSPSIYNTPRLLEGHYIYGYYDNDHIVFWEEKEDNSYSYLSFCFATEEVEYYNSVEEVYELFDFSYEQWSPLCNINDQIIALRD